MKQNDSRNCLRCLVNLILITVATSQVVNNTENNPCATKSTSESCAACFQVKGCVWCKNPEFEDRNHQHYSKFQTIRCNTRNEMIKYCQEEFIEDTISTINYIKNNPTQKAEVGKEPVHISPQLINLQLRVGQPQNVTMTYLEAAHKRLDLYYLMDLSATMSDDKDTVSQQGSNLAKELKTSVTVDVNLGFGSFIDKPLMPFASYRHLYPDKNDEIKIVPYGFKNHLSLNNNTELFNRRVKRAEISRNLDSPEGGLDAVMQVLACKEEIGWRDNATKILIMSTDGPFHIAGDGKLAGIVLPNDGQCHLKNNEYTHSTILDYPSIGQVNRKVKDSFVYVIFAVTSDMTERYKSLSQRIDNSKVVTLAKNSENVVTEIADAYKKLKSTVEFRVTRNSNVKLKLTWFWKCPGNSTQHIATGIQKPACDGVRVGDSFDLTLQVELESCVSNSKEYRSQVEICPFELCNREKLILEIEPICSCPCENETSKANVVCQNEGRLKCGICDCGQKFGGRNCACDKDKSDDYDQTNCTMPNSNDVCSGRGKCECQTCKCQKHEVANLQYLGNYCQHDRRDCVSDFPDIICSGRGKCIVTDNGEGEDAIKCKCDDGWEGQKCECSTDKTTCREPGTPSNTTVCNGQENGQGECSCAAERTCACNSGYYGRFCHTKKDGEFKGWRCENEDLNACVKCHLDLYLNSNSSVNSTVNTNMTGECDLKCEKNSNETGGLEYKFNFVDESVKEDANEQVTCDFTDEDCKITFQYSYKKDSYKKDFLQIAIWKEPQCLPKQELPKPKSPLPLISGIAGSIIFIGILTLLIWKLITHLQDNREFTRFEKQRADAKWAKGNNPIYNSPTATFQNPSYNG